MGLLTLFTSTLLFSWTAVNAAVKITKVELSIEPSATVTRSTNVTLRCKTEVLSDGTGAPDRVYTIYKDDSVIYNKTTSSSESFLFHLPKARVSNNGKYRCKINIMGEKATSDAATLTVEGMSTPILRLNKTNITEGEVVTTTCDALGEPGSLLYTFYDGSKEVESVTDRSHFQVPFLPKGAGDHVIHCSYSVFVFPYLFKSQQSNPVTVTVKELSVEPVLTISPQDNVHEGDTLNISCSLRDFREDRQVVQLYLSQGTELLKNGDTSIQVSWTAHARAPTLTIECRLFVGVVEKVISKTISVTELFSAPTLTMSSPEIFQGDLIQLICKSERISDRFKAGEDLNYSLEPFDLRMERKGRSAVFSGKAKTIDFNYTCTAAAKDIKKRSNVLTLRPKVPVSAPKIWISANPILGRTTDVFCLSETGTPPITYALQKADQQNQKAVVHESKKPANFTIFISKTGELGEYRCSASNSNRKLQLSDHLQAAVIEPMTKADLMVLPVSGDISEGHSITLICSFRGTPPVTVRWFRDGDPNALQTTTTNINTTDHQFTLSKEHSDKYYCKAENRANSVESNRVDLVVGMAMWKKLLIPGIIILVVSSLVMVGFVLFMRSRRGKRETAAELSVKPASPKSDDSLTVTLTHDTEVYRTATVRVGRTPESVWSHRKPETETDDEISTVSNEPEVEYTEVVHHHSGDPVRSPLRKGTDTVYTELQNSPHGVADHHDYGSVKYVDVNGEHQLGINQYKTEAVNYSDLPMPVD